MTTSRLGQRLALGLLAAGSALAVAGACGAGGRQFQHAAKFVVTGSHQGMSCDACHDPTKDTYGLAGGGVACKTCHPDAETTSMHAAVAGFAAAEASCISCHRDGKTPKFDHGFFPIAQGTPHQGIACTSCHGATRAVADLGCVTCHTHDQASTDVAHASVQGYAYSSPACYGCHKNGSVSLPPNHDTDLFPVTGTKHAPVGCSQCHGATKQVGDITCVPCHLQATMATRHAAIPGVVEGITNYEWVSAACLRCHATGTVFRIASHDRSRDGLNGNHQPWCINCHFFMRPAGNKPWGADFGRTDPSKCDACHAVRRGG